MKKKVKKLPDWNKAWQKSKQLEGIRKTERLFYLVRELFELLELGRRKK